MRLLLVDDDAGFRELLRTTFEDVQVEVDEAGSAAEAESRIAASRPDVIVLDVGMPGMDGLAFCRELKASEDTREICVVLLTGMEDVEDVAGAAGADALLLKPFRPLELLGVVERLAGAGVGAPMRRVNGRSDEEQLVLYARDLRHLVEIERAQRGLLESAYKETVSALATALGTKDTGTRQHSQRVQRYALELTRAIDPELAGDPALEYGFLLHDIGKIGVPDQILLKPVELNEAEWRVMKAHTRARRADDRRRRLPPRRRRPGRPLAPRALGRRRATPTGSRARRSRSAPGSSPSPTRSTRSRTTGRTGPPAAGATAGARSSRRRGRSSIRWSSTRSATASTCCTRSAASSSPPRRTACVPVTQSPPARKRCGLDGACVTGTQSLARRVGRVDSAPDGLRSDRGPAGDPGARARGRAGRDRAERRRLGPRAPLPDRALREARRAGADGRLRAGRVRRRGRRLPLLHPRARGALARGCRRRRHRRRPHERLHAADPRLRHRGAARALRAAARTRRDDRRLRADRAGGRLRRGRAPHAGRRGRRRLDDHGREAVDHERQLRRHLPHLRPQRAGDRGRARRLRVPARRRATCA